ncbi:MAG: hypothetical protein LBQ23_00430 [Puniceicoccales bacterium]|jgi:hypothetical protein|nr:hypothetical protein [Puniceicoccales bacterium]
MDVPKYKSIHGDGVEITKVLTPEEAAELHEMFAYGLDEPDPSEVEAVSKEYNSRALAPMLKWAEGFIQNPRVVQYEEVIEKLKGFSPKYNCEIGFCHDVLLPALEKSGQLPKVPVSLIIVLNTLHLVHFEGTRLVSVEKEGPNLFFVDEFKSTVDGKVVPHAYSYRLHNYLSSKDVQLEAIKPVPVEE